MSNIVVPQLGESVVEARVARWLKKEGDRVETGEPVVELETEEIDLEVGAEHSGVLAGITRQEGEDVKVGDVLAVVDDGASGATKNAEETRATPTARRIARDHDVKLDSVSGSGPAGRVMKQDVQNALGRPASQPPTGTAGTHGRTEERVRMSKQRQTIARRLVEAQSTATVLTTFNEIDMTTVMALRERRNEAFKKQFGIGLGIASFFVKASIAALRTVPQLNAEIQGDEIVLKRYYDIGMAVAAEGGLVVPVLRDADAMSFFEIELAIRDYAGRAADGTLTLEDLKGGTFTITSGVFGSLMSTPILNPPQVGILGLHKIEDRVVPTGGQIAIRPMMYVALTYDHRIVDDREAVQFLVKVKDYVEDPGHLLLES